MDFFFVFKVGLLKVGFENEKCDLFVLNYIYLSLLN